ncbi:BTB/POZ domain/Regulator of chromosome condensation (RCC1) repeat [Trypanosoma brucei equiperdum]|uniref:BTB/POZ domain/Regulator of chromosome condensation (RCC1) repeat n=1 Tax=Trypanosoma brucei equiperdum TaxID=630700 RepID=A0A3L6L6K5_9TRYP|nr:BTB/POZ domain/Regulator of chromosome condensation (RCC1) repeat [Trypanosoma brucei equiperdum]
MMRRTGEMHADPNNFTTPLHVGRCGDGDSCDGVSLTRSTQTDSILARRWDFVTLNVGGTPFTTTVSTLCSEPGSLLAVMVQSELRDSFHVEKDGNSAILLDLDPTYFAPVLNYLRHKVLVIPPGVPEAGVLAVAEYLNLRSLIRRMEPERPMRRQLLFSWGSGSCGELGTQRFEDCNTPTFVQITPFGVHVVDVALGASYSCVLAGDGNVYTFGNGDWGQLGLGHTPEVEQHPEDTTTVVTVPQRISMFEREPAVHVAAGYAFAVALTADHHVYFWGNNNHGQSGLGPRSFHCSLRKVEEPTLVTTLEGKHIEQLSCGSFFTLALGTDGTLYSWGLLDCLGLGSEAEVRASVTDISIIGKSLSAEERTVVLEPQVVRVPTEHKLVRIHAGQWHSGAINAAGELFTWGVGYQGRLGHGDNGPVMRPKKVVGALTGRHVVDVACGSFHTVALTDRGAVYCWGDNTSGQCGARPTTDTITSPYRVVNLEFVAGGVARAIACGRQHTVVVMEGPQSWCRRPCCQLGPDGKPKGTHGQVFTFGGVTCPEGSVSSGASSGNMNNNNNNNNNSNSSNQHYYNVGSNNNNNNNASNNLGGCKTQGGMVNRQFRLVPGLEEMNVTNVKSGLRHKFVFAEDRGDDFPTT